MKRVLNKDDFIKEVATRASFTQKDIEIIIQAIITVFTEAVLENSIIKIRGLGKLYTQRIPPRKGGKGQMLPETNRVIFKLAEPIRYADKEEYSQRI